MKPTDTNFRLEAPAGTAGLEAAAGTAGLEAAAGAAGLEAAAGAAGLEAPATGRQDACPTAPVDLLGDTRARMFVDDVMKLPHCVGDVLVVITLSL